MQESAARRHAVPAEIANTCRRLPLITVNHLDDPPAHLQRGSQAEVRHASRWKHAPKLLSKVTRGRTLLKCTLMDLVCEGNRLPPGKLQYDAPSYGECAAQTIKNRCGAQY